MAFARTQPDPILSVITLHELTYGAERVANAARRAKLIAWIAAVRAQFAGRIVAIDGEIAEHSGRLRAAAEAQGRPAEIVDSLIAASALARGAAVATRNTSAYEPMGVEIIDPWAG